MNYRRFPIRGVLLIKAATALTVLSGCQSYRPAPLDLPSHSQTWRAVDLSSEEVRMFADEIAKSRPDEALTFDPIDGLSLPEGEIVGLVFNPDLRIARSQVGIAKATVEHAGRWNDPTFNLDVLKIAEVVPDPWFLGSGLSLTIPISGRLKAEKYQAEAALGVEFDRVAEAEWMTRRNLRDAWVSWSAQRLKLQQTEAIIHSLDSIIESTSRLVAAGELPVTEARLFLIERESRRAELDRLTAAVAEEKQRIVALLGLSPDASVNLIPSLSAVLPQSEEEAPDQSNPTLARLKGEYEIAERTLLTEIRKQYPDLTIGPQAERDEGRSRIGFLGAIPVPIFNSNKQGIAEARAAREVARAVFETEYQRIVGRIASVRARLKGIQSRQKAINKTLVPLVDRQMTDASRLLELGEGSSLVLLESLVRAYEVKLKLIELLLERSQADNETRFLLGPHSLRTSPATIDTTP